MSALTDFTPYLALLEKLKATKPKPDWECGVAHSASRGYRFCVRHARRRVEVSVNRVQDTPASIEEFWNTTARTLNT